MTKAELFRSLHVPGKPLVLPNAWNAGSARMMEQAGFQAIATTSAGIAFSHGLSDGNNLSRDIVFDEIKKIIAVIDLPLTVDIETGYGDVAETVLKAQSLGCVGCNLEDAGGGRAGDLFDIELACETLRQARKAAGDHFVINARTDPYLCGHPEALKESIKRGQAYVEAGADCVFVPGVNTLNEIVTLVNEVSVPINILGGVGPTPLSYQELADCGVARISTGGSLARRTFATLENVLQEVKAGDFSYAVDAIADARMNEMFS